MKNYAMMLSASVLTLGWCGLAEAQTAPAPTTSSTQKAGDGAQTVQEVVVTGERRSTALQKTAIAATVLTGKDLLKDGVFTVDQLQFFAPNVTVNNFGQGNDFDIRGIGKGEHNSQTGTGVVTYRDGAATFPGYFQEEPFYDVAGVEVLRGPQGTFSGQNATGGALIVNTANPVINGGNTGYLLGHYGNYNDTGLQGAVNIPINDTLAARVAFNGEYRNSFYDISGPWKGNSDVMWGSARLSLLWKPTTQLSVLWKTDYNYLNNGAYFGDAMTNIETHNLYKFGNDYNTFALDQFVRSNLKIDYVTDGGITFRSVSSAQWGRTAWKGDIDGMNSTANPSAGVSIDEGVDETLLSQEFNIISPNTGPLTWILGADYQSNVYNFPYGHFDIGFPPGGVDEDLSGTNDTHSWAVFGQGSYNLPAGFQLQVGLRYSSWFTANKAVHWESPELNYYYLLGYVPYSYNYIQNQDESGSNITGKVTLNWNINAHNFMYAFASTGAKPGGLNGTLLFGNGSTPAPFRQEYVTDYELGWKSSFFHNHVHTQLGGYYNIFQHFQVILPIPNEPTQSTEQNVQGRTKLYGVEASTQVVFGDFSASSGLGWGHSQLGTFYSFDSRAGFAATCNPDTGPASGACINLAGRQQTYAPNFTFNAEAQYDFKIGDGDKITPHLSYSHISQQWATLFENRSQGDYLTPRDLVGASLAWTHKTYTASLYCYNCTNDHYIAAVASPVRLAGAPLQVGVSLMKVF